MEEVHVKIGPKEKCPDTNNTLYSVVLSLPQKKTRAGVSQFATSDILYGGKEEVKQQKKGSAVKNAELGGSNAVTHLSPGELKQ